MGTLQSPRAQSAPAPAVSPSAALGEARAMAPGIQALFGPFGAETPAARSAAAPAAAPVVGRCWEHPVPGSLCWKLANPDPRARHDFWLLITSRKTAHDGMVVSVVLPLDDGGLLHCVQLPVFEQAHHTHFVQTMKSSHGSFGVVSISKLEAKVLWDEVQDTFFGTRFVQGRFAADGTLRPPGYRELEGEPLPDLPLTPPDRAAASSAETAPEADRAALDQALEQLDLRQTEPGDAIHFPRVGLDAGGEIEVEGGVLAPSVETASGAGAGAPLDTARPPGFYIDLTYRRHPPLNLAVYSVKPPGGAARIAFVDYCAGFAYERFRERIIVKKSSSWFKKKKKIKIIRDELRIDRLVCDTLFAAERPPAALERMSANRSEVT